MNNKYLLTIFFIFFCSKLTLEEVPKKLIIIEENLELEKKSVDQKNKNSENEIFLEQETNSTKSNTENKNLIIIDDIPTEFNDWYGILSSEQGGLGWLMWGSTNSTLAKNLLELTNFSTKSPILFDLTSKILMSRAKKPKEIENEEGNRQKDSNRNLKYLKAKIKVLSEIGDTENIAKIVDNVPLDIKNENFFNLIYDLRQSDKDIPYICNELKKKNFDIQKDVEKRKTLIACSIAEKKYSQAQLALDLLENDSLESLTFIQTVRKYLEEPSFENLLLDEKDLKNRDYKIISLSNYKIAKKVFSKDILTLKKIIYDLKLYSIKEQLESLEGLVSSGLYNPEMLKNAYADYYFEIQDKVNLDNLNIMESENSLDLRVSLFYLINNTISDIERAKLLNLLWMKAKEVNVEKALYLITFSSINSIAPQRELSWFIYPVTKALINNNKFEEAKNWLFFITNDLADRAALDLNFCKMLLLLHIADIDLKNSNFEVPDAEFLLNILDNSLDVKKESIYNLMITLKALNYEVPSHLWDNFYFDEYESFRSNLNVNKTNLIFILEKSLEKRNLAETALIVIDLLNSSNKEQLNFYYLYKSIFALNSVGLRKYARDFGLEINLDL